MKKVKLVYNNNKTKVKDFKSINPIVAEILLNRGFNTEKEMIEFISKKEDVDYGEMKDIKKAANIISQSIKSNETIVLYSDTDVDGCMSAALGIKLLRKVCESSFYYTNNRFKDGYGLCKTGIDNIVREYPDTKLIITADNGIAAADISYAKEKGLKVVVTDHHEPVETLPSADAIVDPKQKDCRYQFKELCGAGVLYKVLTEVFINLGKAKKETEEVLDLVAFATVGDLVLLIGENRIIVDKGIALINNSPSMAFEVIKETLGIKEITSHDTIAFQLAPMINALSRVTGSIGKGIELFLSDDKDLVKENVLFMQEQNEKRKRMTKEETEIAESLIPSPLDTKALVVYSDNFSDGIIGIIAGRLKEKYNRPTIVLTKVEGTDILKGSARSIEGFHLQGTFKKLNNKFHIFETFGGHAMAAGLSIKEGNLDRLKELIYSEANELLSDQDLLEKVIIDSALTSNDLTLELAEEINKLGPFGNGFNEPIIGLNFNFTNIYNMGAEKQHLKCYDSATDTSVICWNGSNIYNKIKIHLKRQLEGYQ